MKIVLDSNILCADYWFAGGASKMFWAALRRVGATCVVPAVVLDEVVAVYARQLEEASAGMTKAGREWSKLTSKPSPSVPTSSALVKEYDEYLKAHLESHSVLVIPYPEIAHRDLVRRSAARRKPFSESGGGYRDALIWESLRALRSSSDGRICFITNNTKDFGKSPHLHSDLTEDLGNLKMELFNTMEQFNAQRIVPHLEQLDSLREQLQAESVSAFSIAKWINGGICAALNNGEHGSDFVGLEPGHGQVRISSLKGQNNLVVDDVRRLPSGEMVILANVDLRLEVAVSADWEDWENHSDIRDFFGGDCSGSPTAYAEEAGNVAFTLTVSESFEVEWCEVDEVRATWSVEINPHPRRDA